MICERNVEEARESHIHNRQIIGMTKLNLDTL